MSEPLAVPNKGFTDAIKRYLKANLAIRVSCGSSGDVSVGIWLEGEFVTLSSDYVELKCR